MRGGWGGGVTGFGILLAFCWNFVGILLEFCWNFVGILLLVHLAVLLPSCLVLELWHKRIVFWTRDSGLKVLGLDPLIKEENIAIQRSPLDNVIFAQIQQAACTSNNPDLDHSFLLNIVTLSRYIGPCVSEYAQMTQSKIDYHMYPSGRQVIKHFTANDFVFSDAAKHQLNFTDKSSFDMADLVHITWRIQKNQQNSGFSVGRY